jgi:two-component system, chemotaxis family, chemotaxis protein CheY
MLETNTKFLVVDDFQMMRNIVKKMLTECGYTNVVYAVDGIDAQKQVKDAEAQGQPIQFIISDWNMPNMTGMELLKWVRASESYAQLPFIMVTAESEQGQIIDAVKNKVSEYVVKPFNGVTFKQKLDNVCKKLNSNQKAG